MTKNLTISVILFLAAVLIIPVLVNPLHRLPDFATIADVDARKKAFIDYLIPVIQNINRLRAAERRKLQALYEKLNAGNGLSGIERHKLRLWAKRYDVDRNPRNVKAGMDTLLLHLDQIPVSMVLAQAALESAWGTSRFVSDGHNFFGQWCFEQGCGIVPGERQEGASHEVKKFDSTRQALNAYFRNINSHPAYRLVRKIRAQAREKGETLSGLKMVGGLKKYSQRGQAYIDDLRAVIRFNNLERFPVLAAEIP